VTLNTFGGKFSVDFPTRVDKESYAFCSHATVFQSEVYAILACSEYCISEGIVNKAVSIWSDSRAALLALKVWCILGPICGPRGEILSR
jgi:hypothetical protein